MWLLQVFSFGTLWRKSFQQDYSGPFSATCKPLAEESLKATYLCLTSVFESLRSSMDAASQEGSTFLIPSSRTLTATKRPCADTRSISILENGTARPGSQTGVVRTGQKENKEKENPSFSLCSVHGCSSSFPSLLSLQRFLSLPSLTLHLPLFVSQELPGIHHEEVSFPKSSAPHRLSADSLR